MLSEMINVHLNGQAASLSIMLQCVWFNQVCLYEKPPSEPQAPGQISAACTPVKPLSHTTENFNYSGILRAESEGLALIEEGNNWFCPLRGENVSILRRSGCPPPVGGDKRPLHCGCLICVTALVCAEIDVAFHAAACGSASVVGVCSSAPRLRSTRSAECRSHQQTWGDLHRYRYLPCICSTGCF